MTEMEALGVLATDLRNLGESHNKLVEQIRVVLQILSNLNDEIEKLKKH
jgi:hypothetical protein